MPSASYITEMERLRGVLIKPQIILTLDEGTTDITPYYISGGDFDQEKERGVDEISCGDITYTFSNYNNYFSDLDSSSVFYGKNYHNRTITYSIGLMLSTGTIEYLAQNTSQIKSVEVQQENNQVTIQCKDLMSKVIDEKINSYPTGMIPSFAGTGNGYLGDLATKPFVTVNEDITVTLSSASAFSVVGSVTGAMGSGTVGTLFTATGGQLRFLITAGSSAFVNADAFTFTTYLYPQFTSINIVKIIWSLLTGYNYDTDTVLGWGARASLNLDHTKSTANVDINYTDFTALMSSVSITLTGYVQYNKSAKNVFEELLGLCLGSMFVDGDGKIDLNIYTPILGTTPRNFADTKQIVSFNYKKNIDDIINYCHGTYKKSASWSWSNMEETTDGNHSDSDTTSQTNNKGKLDYQFDCIYWYSATNPLIYPFEKLLDRNANAPTTIEFETMLDGINSKIGDVVSVTETKSNLSSVYYEVMAIRKNLSGTPKSITFKVTNTLFAVAWGFCASSVDEGDGISPQPEAYADATTAQKQYAYTNRNYVW
jgi:hypothetical protein